MDKNAITLGLRIGRILAGQSMLSMAGKGGGASAEPDNGEETQSMTIEVTGCHWDGSWHITQYVLAEDLPSVENAAPVWGFDITPVTDFTPIAQATGGYYTVDTINRLHDGYTAVGSMELIPVITDKGNGTFSVSLTDSSVKTHTNARAYWGFGINMVLSPGDRFILSNWYVEVNGVRQKVSAVGGFAGGDTYTTIT